MHHIASPVIRKLTKLDDIEKNLGIDTCPMNWPIGSGKAFKGVFDREHNEVITYADTQKGTKEGTQTRIPIEEGADPEGTR